MPRRLLIVATLLFANISAAQEGPRVGDRVEYVPMYGEKGTIQEI